MTNWIIKQENPLCPNCEKKLKISLGVAENRYLCTHCNEFFSKCVLCGKIAVKIPYCKEHANQARNLL